MSLTDGFQNGIDGIVESAQGLLRNPTATAIGGAVLGGALIGTAVAVTRKAKKKRDKATTRKRSTKRKSSRGYKYARTAGKRKDTSRKRIRMTKTGQPYIILASGKARFIKKSSARQSRKRKGGRY